MACFSFVARQTLMVKASGSLFTKSEQLALVIQSEVFGHEKIISG